MRTATPKRRYPVRRSAGCATLQARIFEVATDTMAPTLQPKELLLGVPVNPARWEKQQGVVVLEVLGGYRLGRLLMVSSLTVALAFDNLNYPTVLIPHQRIRGMYAIQSGLVPSFSDVDPITEHADLEQERP